MDQNAQTGRIITFRPKEEPTVDTDEFVILFGDYDYSYPREVTLRRGLCKNDIRVIDCNLGPQRTLTGWKKVFLVMPSLFYLLHEYNTIDDDYKETILVPRGNHLLIPFAKLLANHSEAQLVYDAFDPLYRTAIMRDENILLIKLKYVLEYITLTLPDQLLVTTSAFRNLYVGDYSLPSKKFIVIEPGADEGKFYPTAQSLKTRFTVLYWGNFHRHHGVDTVLDTAAKLSEYDIKFQFIGDGKEKQRYEDIAKKKDLDQVEFLGRISDNDLLDHINSSHICLGIFSDHLLARCSITNKVFEAMAVGKPIITEKSIATDTIPNDTLVLVSPNSAEDLAESILMLKQKQKIREKYSERAKKIFEREYNENMIGKKFKSEIIHADS